MKQALNMNFMFTSKASKEAKILNSLEESKLVSELQNIERLKQVQLSQIEASHRGFKIKARKKRHHQKQRKQKLEGKKERSGDSLKLPPIVDKGLSVSQINEDATEVMKTKDTLPQVTQFPPIYTMNKDKNEILPSNKRKSVSFDSGINEVERHDKTHVDVVERMPSLQSGILTQPRLRRSSLYQDKNEILTKPRKSVSFDSGINELERHGKTHVGLVGKRPSLRSDALTQPRVRRGSIHPTLLEDLEKMGATRRKRGSMAIPSSRLSRSSSVDVGFLGLHGSNSLKERLRRLASLQSVFYDEDEEEDPDSELGHLFEEIKNCRYLRLPHGDDEGDTDLTQIFGAKI